MSKRTTLVNRTAAAVSSRAVAVALLGLPLILYAVPAAADTWNGRLSQYGEMRLVLGQGRHEGRVRLGDMRTRTHTHALLKDENGQVFTAHVERAEVRGGSVIRLPAR